MAEYPALDWVGVSWRLGATLLLVLINGFFVAAEFALVTVRRGRVGELADEGRFTAKVTRHVLEHLDRYLSSCQLGITMASLVLGALGEPAVGTVVSGAFGLFDVHFAPGSQVLRWTSLAIAFATITVFHMTLGEQAPKMWALRHAEPTALVVALPLRVFTVVFWPFIIFVNWVDPSTEKGWQPAALQKVWGSYFGREKELLRACADVVLAHADELWTLSQTVTIVEAQRFDQALTQMIPDDQQNILDEEDGEWQEVDLLELWEDCLVAHDALWNQPEGLYTLSPNVHFVANTIEYRYQNAEQALAFRVQVSTAQKDLLESFRDARKSVDEGTAEQQDFLRDMVHRKVLWTVQS